MNNRIISHLLLLALCSMYGLFFSLGKIALTFAEPLFLTGVRMIFASIILLCYQFIFDRTSIVFNKAYLLYIFIIGFAGVYITNVGEFWGLQFMTAGKTCFIYCFSPIATAIISHFLFHERLTFKKVFGLIIGILGFLPILMAVVPKEDISGKILFFSYAEIALLLAAIATSIGWIMMRKAVKFKQMNLIMLNSNSMLIGGIIALVHSFHVENWNPVPISNMSNFIIWLIILTIVSNLICYNLHAFLLKSFTATYISLANLADPFFAAFFGWLLLGEILHSEFWVSITCVVIGLSIYYHASLKLNE